MSYVKIMRWSAVLFVFAMVMAVGRAFAADAVLYEVTESVKLSGHNATFKSSAAALSGTLNGGTPLCPTWLLTAYQTTQCGLSVFAIGRADDDTGVGPVDGSLSVVVQDRNTVDGPEVAVIRASINGTIDLSGAFLRGQPVGEIVGGYFARGVQGTPTNGFRRQGRFKGVFRLPFDNNGTASYLVDGGAVPVGDNERSLGMPAVRLEITFID